MTKQVAKTPDATKEVRVNERKWSKPLMDAGWTAFPSVIIERQKAIGLDALDVNIILHLASYWWTKDNKPHPSKTTIANAIGVHPRTVQRRIAKMERDGLIHRQERRVKGKGSRTNLYHFDGLIEAAKPFAKEKIAARKKREKTARETAGRKGRPKLTVVPGTGESED